MAETATQLADLLDAHHYTDGLAFVRPGTADEQHRRSPRRLSTPTTLDTSAALPIEVTARRRSSTITRCVSAPRLACRFDRIAADLRPRRARPRARRSQHAQHECGALAGGLGLLPQQHDRRRGGLDTRTTWIGRGATTSITSAASDRLPTMRCGAQPYGMLPVTSLDLWQPGAGRWRDARRMRGSKAMLLSLRDSVWRPALGVRRADRQPAEPDRSRRRPRRRDADRRGLECVSHAQRVRHATSSSICIDFSAPACPTATRRRPRSCSSSAIAWRPRLSRCAACGLAAERARAARAGGRSLALGQAGAELHRDAPRRAAHRRS